MPDLIRRRNRQGHIETWLVLFGDLQVVTIGRRSGVAVGQDSGQGLRLLSNVLSWLARGRHRATLLQSSRRFCSSAPSATALNTACCLPKQQAAGRVLLRRGYRYLGRVGSRPSDAYRYEMKAARHGSYRFSPGSHYRLQLSYAGYHAIWRRDSREAKCLSISIKTRSPT